MSCYKPIRRAATVTAAFAALAMLFVSAGHGQEKSKGDARRSQLLSAMRSLAEQTKVEYLRAGERDVPHWHFAPARMTSGGVTLTYQKEKVWEIEWVNWNKAPFPTWTFFATPRVKVEDE